MAGAPVFISSLAFTHWTPASPWFRIRPQHPRASAKPHVCTEFGLAVGVQAALPNLEASMQPCRFDKLALSNAARPSSEEAVILALH